MYQSEHLSVLLYEAIHFLNIKPEARYIDCNLGGGGHTEKILGMGGNVLAFEVDQSAIEFASKRLATYLDLGQLRIVKANFREIDTKIQENGWNSVDGILYDLGLSTFQLKDLDKGFSYEDEGPLDMRMDDSLQVKAEDLIKGLSENELADLFLNFGEEPQAKNFARAIKNYARINSSFTSKSISEVIKAASRYRESRVHPATRVFQALRIAVNSELENLRESLSRAVPLLNKNGRLVIISFHSLEDRIAKELKRNPELKPITDEPVVPTEDEIFKNPSSRSAKLRAYEK